MDTTDTTEIDYTEMPVATIATMLRVMVAIRNDKRFMSLERVDAEGMTAQADAMYAALMRNGFSAAQIATLVPGVEVFA